MLYSELKKAALRSHRTHHFGRFYMSPFQRGNSKTLRLLLISGRTQEAERLRSLFSAGGLGNAHVMDAPTLDDAIDFLEKTSMDAVLLDLTQLMGHELEALDTLLKFATNCPV